MVLLVFVMGVEAPVQWLLSSLFKLNDLLIL
jgi:hypothetical protein